MIPVYKVVQPHKKIATICHPNDCDFYFVLEAGLEPAQPQWPRDFKSLAQFHHSSILIFCYCAIKQPLISPYLYKKYCNKMSGLTHSLTPFAENG